MVIIEKNKNFSVLELILRFCLLSLVLERAGCWWVKPNRFDSRVFPRSLSPGLCLNVCHYLGDSGQVQSSPQLSFPLFCCTGLVELSNETGGWA